MGETGDIEYEYQGKNWTLPRAFAEHQTRLLAAHRACDAIAAGGPGDLQAARARFSQLALTKFGPDWSSWRNQFPDGARWQAYAAEQLGIATAP